MASFAAKTAIVTSQFPETNETFVIRELVALHEAGFDLRIYSLKKCRDRIRHPEAEVLVESTKVFAWDDVRVWVRSAGAILRHPVRSTRALAWVLRNESNSVLNLLKAIVVWVQSLALAGQMRKDGVTHIHAHWATMPTTAAVLISRMLRVPFSFTAHAWDIFVPNPSLAKKVALSSAVITCTEYNRETLCELCPGESNKIFLNYHGVDVSKFSDGKIGTERRDCHPSTAHSGDEGQPSPLPVFLSVGRFVEQKGYADLVQAYRIVKERGGSFRAVIVGEGPLRGSIAAQIVESGLADVVEIVPAMPQSELAALYRSACAFVLPCVVAANGDRDGIPNVILEAMAAGLPVISTTVSGVPEAVLDRQSGLCVEPGNSGELAQAVELLIADESLRKSMGERAKHLAVEKFAATIHMPSLVRLMTEITRNHAGSGPIRVAQLIWSLEIGGAERVAESLARYMDRSRFESIVFCLNHEGRLAADLARDDVRVIAMNKRAGLDIRLLPRLVRRLREERIDILHAHLFGAAFWGRIAGKLAGVPQIIVHEHGMQPWRGNGHFMIDRLLARAADRVLFVSEHVRDLYIRRTGISAERCIVVRNGVDCRPTGGLRRDARKRCGWTDKDLIILSVGRLSAEKGHAGFIPIFSDLRKSFANAVLVLVGDGPDRPIIETLIEEFGLNDSVQLAGAQDDVRPWLAAADVYVQPSQREGLSLAVLEAMGAGLPVIATRVGDVEKVITDGRNGFLVPPGDPDSMLSVMSSVLATLPNLSGVGEAACRTVADEYSIEVMVRQIEDIYSANLRGCKSPKAPDLAPESPG